MKNLSVCFSATVLALLSFAQTIQAKPIEIWSRGPGNYTAGAEHKKINRKTLDLTKHKLTQKKVFDFQYNKEVELEGMALETIVGSFKPQSHDSAIMLHFANGMVVPIPSPYDVGIRRVRLFVAHRIKDGKNWTTKFPKVAKASEKWNDPRPITFAGARLSSPTGWHFDTEGRFETGKPSPPPKSDVTPPPFSPWRHTDSLVGIEFVSETAYYNQFTATNRGQDGPGFKVWKQRCQFCHGADRVGAGFGWDFLHPVPLHRMNKPEHLFNKVKYPYHDALERGLQMPQQPDVRSGEMNDLTKWIENLSRKGPRAYRP